MLSGSRPKKSQCFWLDLKTGKKTPNLSPYSQAGGIPSSSAFLFYSGLSLDETHSCQGRQSILLSLPIQMLSPSRITPYKLIQCNVWPNVWVSCSLVIVTQIDHHSPYLGICVKILMAAGTILFIM